MSRTVPFALLTVAAAELLCCSTAVVEEPHPFLSLLPQAGDAGSWRPEDEPQHVVEEDLFLLIDGGAEIYHEYGFKQAVVQSYIDDGDRSLNLEIYEMSDPSAAYGIYTFKRGANGESIDLGDEATLQDYYLNVWKGNVLITVVGLDTDWETREGLEVLAKKVVDEITTSSSKPSLVALLPEEGLNPASIKYMKGGQALFNAHEFAKGNIFGVHEGVMAESHGDKIFVFAYQNENEAKEWIDKAWKQLSAQEGYQSVVTKDGQFSALVSNGLQLRATVEDRYILLAVGESSTATLEALRERLRGSLEESGGGAKRRCGAYPAFRPQTTTNSPGIS